MTTETCAASAGTKSSPISRWISVLAAECSKSGAPFLEEERDPAEPALAFARRTQVPETVLTKAAAEALDVPLHVGALGLSPWPEFVKRFPIAFARQHVVLGL